MLNVYVEADYNETFLWRDCKETKMPDWNALRQREQKLFVFSPGFADVQLIT